MSRATHENAGDLADGGCLAGGGIDLVQRAICEQPAGTVRHDENRSLIFACPAAPF